VNGSVTSVLREHLDRRERDAVGRDRRRRDRDVLRRDVDLDVVELPRGQSPDAVAILVGHLDDVVDVVRVTMM